MSAHVPAWKRLGLKLKGAASDESAIPSSVGSGSSHANNTPVASLCLNGTTNNPASALKRKQPSYQSNVTNSNAFAQTPNKRFRSDNNNDPTPGSLKKSVSFSTDTKKDSVGPQKKAKAKKKKKKTKKPADAAAAKQPETNLEPSLDYLRQWHTSYGSWKFNKNHQTLLIKYLFDGERIPSADIPTFYLYISDLKGAVRTRLRETAADVQKRDMEQGVGALPASTKDKATKQALYEEVVSNFLADLQQYQQQQQNGTNANGKRPLDEVQYVIRTVDPEIKRRLLRRIRAEMVINQLSSDSEDDNTGSTRTAVTTTTTSSTSASASEQETPAPAPTRQRTDGSQQPAKRRRLRNKRTNISSDDDSSSSDSDSSSDSSDGDSDEDEEMPNAPNGNEETSSSSSSSSSSSESDSDEDSNEESADEKEKEKEKEESDSSGSSDNGSD